MDVSLVIWIALLIGILAMLLVDLLLHRDAHVISVREAAIWSAIWVAIGLAVGGAIWAFYGSEFGLQYFAGYVIEKSLAVDNVFVWAVIFSYFAVPRQYQHRVLFYGVVGALVFRAIFIAAGSVLIASFAWILYVFGAFLILTGIKMLRQRNEHIDPSKSKTLRLFRRFVPTTDEYDGQKFLTRRNGVLMATPLLAVVVVVEVTDIIFAVDSIPAIFAVTQEPFLVFASNALAILGLRAMYFLLADLIHRFVYLKAGLSIVLVWVGIKMIVSHAWFTIPTAISLGVVIAIIAVSIIASLWSTRRTATPDGDREEASDVR
jgi:tellurite resistance protein TerC